MTLGLVHCLHCSDPAWLTFDPVCKLCQFADGVATTEQVCEQMREKLCRAAARLRSTELTADA